GWATTVAARHGLGQGPAGAEPGQELAQRIDPAAVQEIADDPERDAVAGARAEGIGVAGQRLDAGERETGRSPEDRVRCRALEDLSQPFVEPTRRAAPRQLVNRGVGVLVDPQPVQAGV